MFYNNILINYTHLMRKIKALQPNIREGGPEKLGFFLDLPRLHQAFQKAGWSLGTKETQYTNEFYFRGHYSL